MLTAIIKDNYNDCNNYLYYDEVNNQCFGYSVDKNGVNFNTNILSLFQNILKFNKNCILVNKKDDYDIYFDCKTELVHFCKNNIEDYEMFFKYNFKMSDFSYDSKNTSVDIFFDDSKNVYKDIYKYKAKTIPNNINKDNTRITSKDENKNTRKSAKKNVHKDKTKNVKRIKSKEKSKKMSKREKRRRFAIIVLSAYTIAFSLSEDVRNFSKLMVMKSTQYHFSQEVNDKIYSTLGDKLNSDSALELIKSTNTLRPETRAFLANKDLLDDIFYYYKDTKMEYVVKNNLENLSIYRFKNVNVGSDTSGFYCLFVGNNIFIRDDIQTDSEYYYSVLAHEFVHLLQSNFTLNYLKEASAEIISNEYFNVPLDSYIDPVQNLKLLVDVIGPRPIFKIMFRDDSSEFKGILKNYLSDNEYAELMILFMKSPQQCTNNDHLKIKEYIHKLYQNMYQDSIYNNYSIYNIEKKYINKTAYFNQRIMFDQDYNISYEIVEHLLANNNLYETRKNIYGCRIDYDEYQSSRKTDVFHTSNGYFKIYRKSDEEFSSIDEYKYLGVKRYCCSNVNYDISFDDHENPLVNVLSIKSKFSDQMINLENNMVLTK